MNITTATGPASLKVVVISGLIAVSVLMADLLLPLGVAGGVPYLALVMMGIWFSKPWHTYVLAVIGTVLTVVGFMLSSSGGVLWMVIANRELALFAIWLTAFLIASRKKYENQLRVAQESLEQKVIERTSELKKSENRFRAVTESAKEAIISADKNGIIIQWNNGAKALFGYNSNEVIGRPITILIPERYQAAHNNGFNNLMAGGELKLKDNIAEVEALCKNGDECSVELSISKWNIDENIFTTAIMRDISKRRLTEKMLHSSEVTLESFLNATIDVAGLVDENGNFCLANKAMAKQFATSVKKLIGKPMFRAPLTKTAKRRQGWLNKVLQTGKPIRATDFSDGVWYDNSYFPVFDNDGNVTRVAIFARDITEHKKTEENLRQLSRVVEQDPNAVFITDTDGTIQFVNAQFTKMTGYTAEDAIGKNPRILKSNDTPPETYEDLWATIKSGKEWRGEIKDRRKDGTYFWAREIIGHVRDDSGMTTHYVAIHEDITIQKEAELALRTAKEDSEIANRAKTELLANMSHELRTPLNAIIGFTGSIKAEIFGPLGNAKYYEYIDHIGDSGVHLLELINDILDVSAVEAGKLELHESEINAADLVEASLRLIKERADKKEIHLNSNIKKGLPMLFADARRMKQILLNILSNAVKFTPQGGEIALYVSLSDNDEFLFVITDSGIGMSNSEISHAMTEFGQVDSTLSRKEEGAGLGLPLTKGLTELHGGTLEITSEKGIGTTAVVKLPNSRTIKK